MWFALNLGNPIPLWLESRAWQWWFLGLFVIGLPHCYQYSGYDIQKKYMIYVYITVINFIGLKVSCHFHVGQWFRATQGPTWTGVGQCDTKWRMLIFHFRNLPWYTGKRNLDITRLFSNRGWFDKPKQKKKIYDLPIKRGDVTPGVVLKPKQC